MGPLALTLIELWVDRNLKFPNSDVAFRQG